MKKLIVLCFAITIVLTGCSNHNWDPQRFKKNDFSGATIGNSKMLKILTDENDVGAMIDLLNIMELKEMDRNLKNEPLIKVDLIGNDSEDSTSIIFTDEKVFFEKEWYAVDLEFIMTLQNFYEELKILEVEDEMMLEIKEKRAARANLDWKEALKGTWIVDDTTTLTFDEEFLYQGDYKFKYSVHGAEGNQILISAYGIHGIFTKHQKVFDMEIIFSKDFCNIQSQKTVLQLGTSDLIFQNNMVYKDTDGKILGDLSSVFFSENLLD